MPKHDWAELYSRSFDPYNSPVEVIHVHFFYVTNNIGAKAEAYKVEEMGEALPRFPFESFWLLTNAIASISLTMIVSRGSLNI
jgi:hypothetical protein